MATTFNNRVEDYIGSYRGNIIQIDWFAAMGEWLTASARELFEIVPITRLRMMSSPVAEIPVTTEVIPGYDIAGKRIISITKEGYPAKEIDDSDYAKYADENSLFYATNRSPVYYITEGYLKVIPNDDNDAGDDVAGKIHFVEAPSVDYDDVSIDNFPPELETTVVLGAAIKARIRQLAEKRGDMPSDLVLSDMPSAPVLDLSMTTPLSDISYSSPSAPDHPAAPVITSDDATATGISSQEITIGTAPTYIAPAFSTPSLGNIDDLDISEISTASSIGTIAQAVSISGNAPTYTGPVVAPDFSNAETWLNDEEDSEMVSSRMQIIQGQLSEFQAGVQNAVNVFNKENVEYQALLQKAITDAQLADKEEARELQEFQIEVARYQAEVNAEIQRWTVEDFTPTMQEWQTEYSSRLQKLSGDIQISLNSFNAESAEYQAELQKEIAQAQLDVQRLTAVASQADSIDLQNKANTLQASIQDYQLELSRYSADVQKYSSEQADAANAMQVAIQKRTSELQELAQLNQDALAKYSQQIQAQGSATQSEIQDYTTKVQRYSQEHQLMSQELQALQSQYQQALQILMQGQQKNLKSQVEE